MHKGIVINLDRRTDRWDAFCKQEFPFPIERMSGVVASCGEDGCTASHLKAIRSITEFPTIVFEDDCQMIQPWSVVENAMSQLPPTWDALFLGATLTRPIIRYSPNLFELKRAYCLHAVIYNSQKMIDFVVKNHHTRPGKNLDIFYRKEVLDTFNCFITYPIVAIQASGISDICEDYVEYGVKEMIDTYNKFTDPRAHEIYARNIRPVNPPFLRPQRTAIPRRRRLRRG